MNATLEELKARRKNVEALLSGIQTGVTTIPEAAEGYSTLLFNFGVKGFDEGVKLKEKVYTIGRQIILDNLLTSSLSSAQQVMCEQVKTLIDATRIVPTGRFRDIRVGQIERTGGFELSQNLIFVPSYPSACLFSWELQLNHLFTEEPESVAVMGRPILSVYASQDDDGKIIVRCIFAYGTDTARTKQYLVLSPSPGDVQNMDYVHIPDSASEEVLRNYRKFMKLAESVADKL